MVRGCSGGFGGIRIDQSFMGNHDSVQPSGWDLRVFTADPQTTV